MDNFEFYDGKTLQDVCKDIIANSQSKRDQIDIMTSELRAKIQNINDAQALAPIVKEMLSVGIKNDEMLVKLAAIAQRLISAKTIAQAEGGGRGEVTEDERKALLAGLSSLNIDALAPIRVTIPAPRDEEE